MSISIKFILQKSRGSDETKRTIYVQLIYKREKAIASLNITVPEEEWDAKAELLKPIRKYNIVQNNKLKEVEYNIQEIYNEFIKKGSVISVKQIMKTFKGETLELGSALFMDYYNQYVNEIKQRPNEYGEGTIAHYHKTSIHLQRFLKAQGWQKIKLNELSARFLERFEHFLLTYVNVQTGRPMNSNTMSTYMRKVKAVINSAVRAQILQSNPFVGFKLKTLRMVNKVILTKEERLALKDHELGDNLALQRVRDCFIFCCETGLRHSDAVQLKSNMITVDSEGMYWITLNQVKTDDTLDIPMSDEAVRIYNKFEAHRIATGFVLPMLTNQKVNAYLKTIADLVGIQKRLTWHSSRHTHATGLLEDGIDISTVSSLLGHRSIKTTQIYSRVTRTRKANVIRELNRLREENQTKCSN